MTKRTYKPLKDMVSAQQNKQAVMDDDERKGFVFKRDGKWFGYVYGRSDVLGTGKNRDEAFADAVQKLQAQDA